MALALVNRSLVDTNILNQHTKRTRTNQLLTESSKLLIEAASLQIEMRWILKEMKQLRKNDNLLDTTALEALKLQYQTFAAKSLDLQQQAKEMLTEISILNKPCSITWKDENPLPEILEQYVLPIERLTTS